MNSLVIGRVVCMPNCCKVFNDSLLIAGPSFEVETGYHNTFSRTMRFSSFLHSKLSKWCAKSKHMSTQKLLEEVVGYNSASMSERSKYLNKIWALLCYDNLEGLIVQDKSQREPSTDMESVREELNLTLACEKFPSIKLGHSSLVQLYNEVDYNKGNGLFPENHHTFIPVKLNEAWQLFGSPFSSISASSLDEKIYQTIDSGVEAMLATKVADRKSDIHAHASASETSVGTKFSLDNSIRCLPGISIKQLHRLEDCGFHTVRKLLHHFPRTYADLQNPHNAIYDGQYLMFVGTVLSSRGIKAGASFSFLEVVVGCKIADGGTAPNIHYKELRDGKVKMMYLHLRKFFRGTRFTCRPFLKHIESKYVEGNLVCVTGKVKKMRAEGHYEMREFNIDILEKDEEQLAHLERKPYALYPSKGGLKPTLLTDVINQALKILPRDIDPIPSEILKEFDLLTLYDAYTGIHYPSTLAEADLARRRLIFDDFFYSQLGRLFQMLDALGTQGEKLELLDKYINYDLNVVEGENWSLSTKKFLEALPYSLTPSQIRAVSEIIWDLSRPVPMNRLLQGDVGCGKTVVAFLACMEVIGSGFQAAFMVPTELLALQHYEHLSSILENVEGSYKPTAALLTGSTSSRESKAILKGLQTGDIAMVIGTHSLISEKVEFSALRIAVVDEQHCFGVIQRGRFNSKLYSLSKGIQSNATTKSELDEDKVYMAPHVLAMSATPIPRTLALALYGDVSLTQITELPPGRIPVETVALEGNEIGFEDVFQMMREELIGGGRVYLVYPFIDESEQLPQVRAACAEFQSISEKFESYKCELLHGRMKSDEKDEALRKFRSGETHILLATQMIEVGVDVPDASMMVVMNAERFGIAQLHQLRGRVGRGERKSKCVFLSSTSGTLERLKVLEKSSDGFYLAKADLLIRGPGNLLGKKQSGHLPEFPIARLEVDGNLLQEAHLAALKILTASHDLEKFPKLRAELSMRQPLCILGD